MNRRDSGHVFPSPLSKALRDFKEQASQDTTTPPTLNDFIGKAGVYSICKCMAAARREGDI